MPFRDRAGDRAGRSGPRHEVGPSEFLAASIAEGVTRGGIAAVRHFPTRRYHHLYDVGLTDGRRVIVRIGLPEERAAIARTAFWTDQLRPLGVPVPEILARDLTSLFPSLVTERLPGSRLGRALPRLPRPAAVAAAGHGRLGGDTRGPAGAGRPLPRRRSLRVVERSGLASP